VDLDPDRDHLIWRAAYAEPPLFNGEPLSATAAWVDAAVYAGTYHIELFGMDTEVSANEDGMFLEVGGDKRQLFAHEPHRFVTYSVVLEFEIADGRAVGFDYVMASGRVAKGIRTE
jgi:hypothetical protein